MLRRIRSSFAVSTYRMLVAASVFTICAELSFTAYIGVSDFANMAGHIFKLASFYLIYRAIFVTSIKDPFGIVFRELKETERSLLTTRESIELQVQTRTAELQQTQEMLSLERHLLSERVKEQRCLYDIFAMTEDMDGHFDSLLQQVAERVGAGLQYPDITAVQLEYAGIQHSQFQ